ncbi:xanthine dehydrogenase family protein molybdopterin-binding subunit [Rhodovulum sp. DZ06]|uniref:xanthine dehydrogenase family protein molybdopterin-binding subunit n=1 Tax=Rhodovulum sp. DZ06 TaxID=3425126 RepID=UPI003D349502
MSALTEDLSAKLSGAFRYLADDAPEGCLHAAVLRSPLPHARIEALDLAPALAMPGVVAAISAADMPPGLRLGLRLRDQPPLADGVVRMVGEPIAAIAARTAAEASAAVDAIALALTPLPPVTDPGAALAPGATPLHPGGNLCSRFDYAVGDADAALPRAAHRVELSLRTPRQMHAAMETEGGIAFPTANGLHIRAPGHDPLGAARAAAEITGLAAEDITVQASPIGGSFGGKEDLHVQPMLALLAHRAGAPVRLVLSRPESVAAGIKRHPFDIRLSVGCDAEGRLTALSVDALADTGAYASHGPEVLDTAMENAPGPYAIPDLRLTGRLAYTNTGVSGAFRGFGAVQTECAIEAAMEALAKRAGLHPLELRRRNLAPDAGPLGQRIVPRPEFHAVLDAMEALPPAPEARPETAPRRHVLGTGWALVSKGEGFAQGGPNGAAGALALEADGRLTLRAGLVDMGQNLAPSAAALLAGALGVAEGDCAAVFGGTGDGDAGPTSASRGAQIAARLVTAGAEGFRAALLARAGAQAPGPWTLVPGGLAHPGDNAPRISFAALAAACAKDGPLVHPVTVPAIETDPGPVPGHALFATCGARAVVAVDTATGAARCLALDILPACGKPILPKVYEGQVAGGAVQALGFCLTEDLPAAEGAFAASNLDGYFIPTLADAPEIRVHPVDALAPDDPVGRRGVGEIALNAAAPAILNALADALGGAPAALPLRAAEALDLLEARR